MSSLLVKIWREEKQVVTAGNSLRRKVKRTPSNSLSGWFFAKNNSVFLCINVFETASF